ncbi:hypothetical protein DFH06DRAFT_167193 [Mycena polygramma]|nr:hypothetical protein DFH06DRAFT_167193 [Mycena polygramma]
MSYYPAQPSYAQPQPAYSPGSGYNGHGYHPSSPGYHPNSPGYFDQPAPYGAQSVVYVPGHSSSHRSRHHSPRQPIVLTGTVVTTTSGSSRHHRRGRHHSRHRSSHEHLSLGERICRFFGFGPKHYRYKSSKSSWGFLGRSPRREYIDARTGAEVDRHGRRVYRL